MRLLSTKGLKWRPRKNGPPAAYWTAPADAVKQGYRPTVVRIAYDADDPNHLQAIEFACERLRAEISSVLNGARRTSAFDGTVKALIERYIYDLESPFQTHKHTTQAPYLKYARLIIKTIGSRAIHACDGRDVKRWFNGWAEDQHGGAPHLAKAQMCLTVLKSALAYGIMCRRPHCAGLREIMRVMRLPSPRPRKQVPTREQIIAIRAAAHELGEPAVALATALQFETMQRMWDVVGQWLPMHAPEVSSIIHRGRKWIGPQWSDVDELVLRWQPTKTRRTTGRIVEVDLSVCPMVMEELQRVPVEKRSGPLIVAQNGRPYAELSYRRVFRLAAQKSGVPNEMWCRDIRAGGITEARKSGASLDDASKTAGHSSVQTTARVYDRDTLEAHRRVAAARSKNAGDVQRPDLKAVAEEDTSPV